LSSFKYFLSITRRSAIVTTAIATGIYKATNFGIGLSALNNAANAVQAYRDAVDKMHEKYGDCLPENIQNALDQWKKDLLTQFGPSVAPAITGVPGTSFNPIQRRRTS